MGLRQGMGEVCGLLGSMKNQETPPPWARIVLALGEAIDRFTFLTSRVDLAVQMFCAAKLAFPERD